MFKRIASAFLAFSFLTAAAAYAKPQTVTIKMRAENKSGETGTAQLMQLPQGVQVKISLTGAPAEAQPAHIHEGSCQRLNPAPKIMLTSVTAGHSTTFVKGAKLSDWMGGKYAINVHKSTADLKTYVSCGAIK